MPCRLGKEMGTPSHWKRAERSAEGPFLKACGAGVPGESSKQPLSLGRRCLSAGPGPGAWTADLLQAGKAATFAVPQVGPAAPDSCRSAAAAPSFPGPRTTSYFWCGCCKGNQTGSVFLFSSTMISRPLKPPAVWVPWPGDHPPAWLSLVLLGLNCSWPTPLPPTPIPTPSQRIKWVFPPGSSS